MNYIFVDTAEGTRVLLRVGDKYLYAEDLKSAGAETLMPMIDGLLTEGGLSLGELDIIGACVGPGSFTGLRIGLTTVKTLCYCLDKPCFAVNNLRLNAYNNDSGKVISVADAGSSVCYIARYDGDTELEAAKCVTLDDARAIIAAHGDFAVSADVKLGKLLGVRSGIGEREMRLAAERAVASPISYKELLPLYVRKPQPERGVGDL